MTREELRDYVNEQRTLNNIPYHVYSALIDGIDTLEQEPSDDCISRQAVLENAFAIYTHECGLVEVVGAATIKDLPPVKPQEPKGHWISFGVQGEMDGGQIVQAFTCSECGTISIFRMSSENIVNGNICPNCGAKMEVEQNG